MLGMIGSRVRIDLCSSFVGAESVTVEEVAGRGETIGAEEREEGVGSPDETAFVGGESI
jgi:hypothetical protein